MTHARASDARSFVDARGASDRASRARRRPRPRSPPTTDLARLRAWTRGRFVRFSVTCIRDRWLRARVRRSRVGGGDDDDDDASDATTTEDDARIVMPGDDRRRRRPTKTTTTTTTTKMTPIPTTRVDGDDGDSD